MPASITLTVAHLPTTTSFFLSSLQPLDYVYRGRVNDTIGFGHPDAAPDFWITQSVPGVPPGPAHVAFPATSRRQVHDFFSNAIRAGARVHGEPALRDLQGYYSAAVIDFDGNSIEAVYRPDLLGHTKDSMSPSSRTVVSKTDSKQSTLVSSATRPKSSIVGSTASMATKAKTVTPTDIGSAARNAPPRSSAQRSLTEASSTAKSTVSRSPPSQAHIPAVQPPRGDVIDNIIANAQDAVCMAKEFVNQARPHMTSASANGSKNSSSGPSDAVIGTLFGVAAGVALHYALSRRESHDQSASAPPSRKASPPFGGVARSATVPSYTEERFRDYYESPRSSRAIEVVPSTYHGSQRLIKMIDNDPASVEHTSVDRPRRHNSLSEVSRSATSKSHTTASRSRATKVTDTPPPTSYRAPTTSTKSNHTPSTTSRSQIGHHRRTSSATRSDARTVKHSTPRHDEGYASASEIRSKTSRSSNQQFNPTNLTRHPSSSQHHHHSPPSSASPPLHIPPSRAATWAAASDTSTPPSAPRRSTKTETKNPSTIVIGHLTESQLRKLEDNRGGNLQGVTRSVVGKVREADRLDVSRSEVRPEDSVSQC